ncbi:hypothetical protein FQA39_LY16089 [Lamprigera yunnana]|nr:hypothetical protein FQA39_LY16089 [Lamprigera yunnana]
MAIELTTNSEAHASNAGPPSPADNNCITHGTPITQPFADTGMSVINHKTHYSDKTDNAKIKNKAKPPSAIKRNKERALKHREMKFQQPETKITSNKSTQTAKHCKNATTKFWQRLIICRTRDIDQDDDSNETESKITKATQLEPAIPDNHLLKEPVNTGRKPTRFLYFEEMDQLVGQKPNCSSPHSFNVLSVNSSAGTSKESSPSRPDTPSTDDTNESTELTPRNKRKQQVKGVGILKKRLLEKKIIGFEAQEAHQERKIVVDEQKCELLEKYLKLKEKD